MVVSYSHEEVLAFCERLEKTYTPAVADTLDDLGFMHQTMESGFLPIMPEAVVAGPAYTIEEARTKKSKRLSDYEPGFVAQALTLLFDNMQKGQIIV